MKTKLTNYLNNNSAVGDKTIVSNKYKFKTLIYTK